MDAKSVADVRREIKLHLTTGARLSSAALNAVYAAGALAAIRRGRLHNVQLADVHERALEEARPGGGARATAAGAATSGATATPAAAAAAPAPASGGVGSAADARPQTQGGICRLGPDRRGHLSRQRTL